MMDYTALFTAFIASAVVMMLFSAGDHFMMIALLAGLFLALSFIVSPLKWPPDWEQ